MEEEIEDDGTSAAEGVVDVVVEAVDEVSYQYYCFVFTYLPALTNSVRFHFAFLHICPMNVGRLSLIVSVDASSLEAIMHFANLQEFELSLIDSHFAILLTF